MPDEAARRAHAELVGTGRMTKQPGTRPGPRPGAPLQDLIDTVRREHVPDFRSGVFDVHAERSGDTVVLRGQSTHEDAVLELVARLRREGLRTVDEVVQLPDLTVGVHTHALVRAAVAPVYAEPRLPAPQISQVVLGMRVELLSRAGDWTRIRSEDGYLGWVHDGYLAAGSEEWAFAWERSTAGEPVVSLGAQLVDAQGGPIARLPWGARLIRQRGAYHLPDGRIGDVAHGEVVAMDRLSELFPPRAETLAATARRWLGAPYLWGGLTLNGVDCSGFSQAVMWLHGIALPRDSDLQARIVTGVAVESDVTALRVGDLVFFAEAGARVSHVAISLGGPLIIHSALGNGGVAVNDLSGSLPLEQRLRVMLASARRVLPD